MSNASDSDTKRDNVPTAPVDVLHESTHKHAVFGVERDVRVRVGNILLAKDDGTTTRVTDADMHFVYYEIAAQNSARRPITFCFNGGPGSSSLWLHLGMLGPLRIQMRDPLDAAPLPPHELIASDGTLLDQSDLVFVDPVGTGFSRRVASEKGERFFSIEDDLQASTDFVVEFVRRFSLWNREKNLLGESYGGLRVAGMLEKLLERGVAISHAVLVSPALDYATLDEGAGNILPSVCLLPSYAATAAYHGKITQPPAALHDHLEAVRTFARTSYLSTLLAAGDVSDSEYQNVATKLGVIAGLDAEALAKRFLDIPVGYFCSALLAGEGAIIGRLDARVRGVAAKPFSSDAEDDPSYSYSLPVFAAAQNEMLRERYGFVSALEYQSFSHQTHKQWRFVVEKDRAGGFPNVVPSLRRALLKSPHTKVFVAAGLYDLATPFFSIELSLAQLGRERSLRQRVRSEIYAAGHMMYLHDESRVQFRQHLRGWLEKTA